VHEEEREGETMKECEGKNVECRIIIFLFPVTESIDGRARIHRSRRSL